MPSTVLGHPVQGDLGHPVQGDLGHPVQGDMVMLMIVLFSGRAKSPNIIPLQYLKSDCMNKVCTSVLFLIFS
jgi:hypothetical protein